MGVVSFLYEHIVQIILIIVFITLAIIVLSRLSLTEIEKLLPFA